MYINTAKIEANCLTRGALLHACNVKFSTKDLLKMIEKCTRNGTQGAQREALKVLEKMEEAVWKPHSGFSFGQTPNEYVRIAFSGGDYRLKFSNDSGNLELIGIGT